MLGRRRREREKKETLSISSCVENGRILCRAVTGLETFKWAKSADASYLPCGNGFVCGPNPPLLSRRNIGGLAPFTFCCPGHLFWLGNEVLHRAIPRIIDTVSSEVTKNIPLVLIPLVKWQCMKRLQLSTELKVYYCFRLQQKPVGELVNNISRSFFFSDLTG